MAAVLGDNRACSCGNGEEDMKDSQKIQITWGMLMKMCNAYSHYCQEAVDDIYCTESFEDYVIRRYGRYIKKVK
jgi:hypothetical protein